MGLDMYACATRKPLNSAVDFKADTANELHYWRKHPNLHGWMEALYREKGGSADEFNCVSVALTREDLDRLEADVRAKCLPYTTGFFFGESDGTEIHDDLSFIAKGTRGAFQ